MKDTKIKHCPFCNGIAFCEEIKIKEDGRTYIVYQVFCDDCEASSRQSYTRCNAISAWNRRYW